MIVIRKEYRGFKMMLYATRYANGRMPRRNGPHLSEFVAAFDRPTLLADLVEWLNRQTPEVVAGDAWLAARYPEIIHELATIAFGDKTNGK
jgi:hypothetical protein